MHKSSASSHPEMTKPSAIPVAVIGGGIMGALSALLAARSGYGVVWFAPDEEGRTDGADARNYALSPLTVDLLQRLGVWPALHRKTCTVSRMEVFTGDVRVDLSATDAGAEFLSVMVLHRDLLTALEQAVQFRPEIQRIRSRPDALFIQPSGAIVRHQEGHLAAKLLVGADGARSWVRQQAGILWGQRDYQQRALVAAFTTEFPHGGIAAQWFDQGDILALLPLSEPHQVSMVWSTSRSMSDIPQDPAALAGFIQQRSQQRFGQLTLTSELSAAPLRMMLTESQSALRTVLVGDAAHTVHPLAGYGLNLGVQDLLCLENLWKSAPEDPGASPLISRYERARQHRVKRAQWGLDLLQRLAVQSHPTMSKLRRLGMKLVADIGPLRQFLIRQAISPQ